ncbi:MAG TPA: GNAT family N-acetyltransferase [Gemmatimonadales bacterium]|nr:GNAT family N-acetyltransferase [Gemmatimonadales bacterium]
MIPLPAGAALELRPLDRSHYELIRALEEQEDVWESIGPLPLPEERDAHLFAVVEEGTPIGVGGLVPSRALGGRDFELFCALRSEAQMRGLATHACQLILGWAFDKARIERVVACIGDDNEGGKTIAAKLGMKASRPIPPDRTVYVKARAEGAPARP